MSPVIQFYLGCVLVAVAPVPWAILQFRIRSQSISAVKRLEAAGIDTGTYVLREVARLQQERRPIRRLHARWKVRSLERAHRQAMKQVNHDRRPGDG